MYDSRELSYGSAQRKGDSRRNLKSRLSPNVAPDWLHELRSSLDVHLIRANRLEISNISFGSRRNVSRRRPNASVVGAYAAELADQIRSVLAKYAEMSQSLDRSFPRRLVQAAAPSDLSMEQIDKRLRSLEEKRIELTEAGLLDKEAGAQGQRTLSRCAE